MLRARSIFLSALIVPAALAVGQTQPATAPQNVVIEANLRVKPGYVPREPLRGTVVSSTATHLTVKTAKGNVTLPWTDLTGAAAYQVRMRLMDRTSAEAWLDLAAFAWSLNAKDEARGAAGKAVELNRDLKPRAEALFKTDAGAALKSPDPGAHDSVIPPTATPTTSGNHPGELFSDVPSTGGAAAKITRFPAATPALQAAALAQARQHSAQFAGKYQTKLVELATEHCVLFTDAPTDQHDFLKKAAEAAHAAVAKALDTKEPLYPGPVAMYLVTNRRTFEKAAEELDSVNLDATVIGYFAYGEPAGVQPAGAGDGSAGHVTLCLAGLKADDESSRADIQYVLAREYTHAFLARYISNQALPAWFAQGLGNHIASAGPSPAARDLARKYAAAHDSLKDLFVAAMLDPDALPVAQTLVDVLVARDPNPIPALVRAGKQGGAFEAALKSAAGLTPAALEAAWRASLK